MELGQLREDFLSFLNAVPVIRAIIGSIIVFLLPGFAWTLVLFNKINNIERFALSVGLSIASVTVSVLVINLLFKVRITGTNALIIIAVITVIPLVVYFFKKSRRKSKTEDIEEMEEVEEKEE